MDRAADAGYYRVYADKFRSKIRHNRRLCSEYRYKLGTNADPDLLWLYVHELTQGKCAVSVLVPYSGESEHPADERTVFVDAAMVGRVGPVQRATKPTAVMALCRQAAGSKPVRIIAVVANQMEGDKVRLYGQNVRDKSFTARSAAKRACKAGSGDKGIDGSVRTRIHIG